MLRLALAAISGWLAAWVLLPEDWLPHPQDIFAWYLPGTLFGLFVLVPLIDNPIRHWARSMFLLLVASYSHWAMWFVGLTAEEYADYLDLHGYATHETAYLIIGALAGIVFGLINSVAVARVARIRFARSSWGAICLVSCMGGALFAAVLLRLFGLIEPSQANFVVESLNVYLAYVVFFLPFAAILGLGERRAIGKVERTDLVLFVVFMLLMLLSTIWSLSIWA